MSPRPSWLREILLAALCALIVGFYFRTCHGVVSELGNRTAKDAYYNLLVQGFARGHLHLAQEAPPAFAQLPDPYDPAATASFRKGMFSEGRIHDLSYYEGKLYLYFGVTPALILLWPYHALTGHFLDHAQAVAVFSSVGFLTAVLLLRSLQRRCFPNTSLWITGACVVALGLANSVPALMGRPDVWEVPLSCGYALVMLALFFLWRALAAACSATGNLVAASTAYGLAIGARPTLVLGVGVLFLVPFFRRRMAGNAPQTIRGAKDWMAILLPLALIGLGLAAYNYQRFGSIFEFGQRYQLASDRQGTSRAFDLGYLWFNFRQYFCSLLPWSDGFPYLDRLSVSEAPEGHAPVESAYGIFAYAPWALFAGLAPWAHRTAANSTRENLRRWLLLAFLLFAIFATTLGLFYGTCIRYMVEFHPVLVVIACVGLMGAVHSSSADSSWKIATRALAWATAIYSAGCSVLLAEQSVAERIVMQGFVAESERNLPEALRLYDEAGRRKPSLVDAHLMAASAANRLGNHQDALARLAALLEKHPRHPIAHLEMARRLIDEGKNDQAIHHLRMAAELAPDLPAPHYNLGVLLSQRGEWKSAAHHLRRAAELQPDASAVHRSLSFVLRNLGETQEAEHHARIAYELENRTANPR